MMTPIPDDATAIATVYYLHERDDLGTLVRYDGDEAGLCVHWHTGEVDDVVESGDRLLTEHGVLLTVVELHDLPLRRLRVRAGLPVQVAARKMQVRPVTWSRWESGSRRPAVLDLHLLAGLLGLSREEIGELVVWWGSR